MVSAISLCLLALGLTAASSQYLSGEAESPDVQVSERRTFKHGKPVKILPLAKKHKKFGGLVPHVFGKTQYEFPVIHEAPKPFYKIHRYHGIEVKPSSDVSFSTPEPYIESHSIEPPSGDFEHSFSSDHSFSSPSSVFVYDKPSFSSPPEPVFAPLPPAPPKQIFSFVSAPQPVFQSIPIAPPAFPPVSLARPAQILPPAPVFTQIPASLPPPQTVFSLIPIKFQTQALPTLPAPSPAPVFSPVPIKIQHQAPALPSLPAPTPAPVFPSPSPAPVFVKIPAPVLPSVPAPSPAPILPNIPVVSATPAPAFSSIPVSLPPPQFSIPAPAPSLPTFPSFSIPSTPEPEFPYPPSGTPIPSYIKDISLGDIEIKGSALPTIEPHKFEEVTPVPDDGSKNLEHVLGMIKNDPGFFQKFKGWKADKANAAFNHFTNFKQKPIIQAPAVHPANKFPVEGPAQPTIQFPSPVHSLPLAPAQPSIFPVFPPTQFFTPAKYENFPPNNIESPPLLNSYGVPIPHDSYAPSHISHERLSSAASEEEPAVVAAPEKKEQNVQQQQQQLPQKFQPQNFQQAASHDHPVYVAEDNKTLKGDNKTIDDEQPESEDYKPGKEQSAEDVASNAQNYPNHKE